MRAQLSTAEKITDPTAEASPWECPDFQSRNHAKEEDECFIVPVEDALMGPGHVARKLIEDAGAESFALNRSHICFVSLCILSYRASVANSYATTATQ